MLACDEPRPAAELRLRSFDDTVSAPGIRLGAGLGADGHYQRALVSRRAGRISQAIARNDVLPR